MAKDLVVKIIGDVSSYSRALGKAGSETQTFGSKIGGLGKTAALAAGSAGVAALTTAVTIGVDEWVDHQRVAAQTAAVLKSTGGVAGVTAKHVENLANQVLNYSGIDDEAVQATANLVLGFTNIRNEAGKGNDVFDRTVRLVEDYSKRTGKDANSAAVLFGRSLNDLAKGKIPTTIRGVGALSDATRKEIAAHLKAGDVVGAQGILLKELEARYGGAAAAAGKTLPGQIDILREKFRNLMGQGIQVVIDKLIEMGPTFRTFADLIGKFSDVIGPVAKLLFDNFVTPFKVLADLIRGDWTKLWQDLKQPIDDFVAVAVAVWGHLSGVIMPAVNAVTGAVTTAWNAVESATTGVWNGIVGFVTGVWDGISGAATGAFDAVAGAVTGAWNTVESATTGVWNGANSLVTGIWNGLSGLATTVFGAITTAVTTAWGTISTLTTTTWSAVQTAITTALTVASGIVTTVIGAIRTAVTTAWTFLSGLTTTTWNAIKTAITTAINFAKGIVDTAVGAIKTAVSFGGLLGIVTGEWNGIKSAITGAINAAKGVVTTAANAIRKAINETFDAFGKIPGAVKKLLVAPINGAIDLINGIRIPGFSIHIPIPFAPDIDFGWGGASPFHIPHLAAGGIVTKPTLALLGEAGPEKVTPLSGKHAQQGIVVNVTHNGALVGSDGMAEFANIVYRELARKAGRNVRLGLG